MIKSKVRIVIPLYTPELRQEEWRSLRRTAEVLGHYPVTLLVPHDMAVGKIAVLFPGCDVVCVGEEWLGRRHGIAGYNAMAMSGAFYDLFADAEYILICQSDAWIFRDELTAWCDKGYDYLGAPLPRKPLYDLLPVRWYLSLRRALTVGILRQDLMGHCLNGGLSLRRVASFRRACDTYKEEAARFLENPHHLYNEDVFWSLIPREFSYPSVAQAARFSFDVKPEVCFRLTDGELPMGCHGWFKEPMASFWRPIIGGE